MTETLSDNNNPSCYLRAYNMPGLVVYGHHLISCLEKLLKLTLNFTPLCGEETEGGAPREANTSDIGLAY